MLETELLIKEPIADVVKKYAENAKKAGLDGVVCSPLEAPIMTLLDLISVTPGIRLLGDSVNDQKRVSTPEGAKKMGSTYIVVGRSITAAEDPLAAYERCVAEFCD
jgi:orotidine-5'-phosphate decarboxylase